jgi:hypothetical protein
MDAKEAIGKIINPALNALSGDGIPVTDKARALLYAIGMQESRFAYSKQVSSSSPLPGPAMGYWQFEAAGGVAGVLTHKSTSAAAQKHARQYLYRVNVDSVWAALAYEPSLAAVFARLLLYTDPKALPDATPENEGAAWDYYIRNWRPGKPHRESWGKFWAAAVNAVAGG